MLITTDLQIYFDGLRNSFVKFMYGLGDSGEIMGSIVCFSLELYCVVNAVELLCEDCELNCTEVSQEAARNRNSCSQKVRAIRGLID